MFLIYTPEVTSRLKFVFKQVCTRMLGLPIDFTNVIQTLMAQHALKMTNGSQP